MRAHRLDPATPIPVVTHPRFPPPSDPKQIRIGRGVAAWLAVLAVLAACGARPPHPQSRPTHLERVRTEPQGPVQAKVAALGPAESRQHFGVDLAARGIQPVWLEIQNGSDTTL